MKKGILTDETINQVIGHNCDRQASLRKWEFKGVWSVVTLVHSSGYHTPCKPQSAREEYAFQIKGSIVSAEDTKQAKD